MTLRDRIASELISEISSVNETGVAFMAFYVTRRSDESLNATFFHFEDEELTNDLRSKIATALRTLADHVLNGADE